MHPLRRHTYYYFRFFAITGIRCCRERVRADTWLSDGHLCSSGDLASHFFAILFQHQPRPTLFTVCGQSPVISEERFATLAGVRLFLSNHFYGGNIVLQDEPAFDFVGFSLDVPGELLGTIARAKPRTYPAMCLLLRKLVRGILARAHTINKCAFPSAQVQADLRDLWNLAVERKFPVHISVFFQKFGNK